MVNKKTDYPWKAERIIIFLFPPVLIIVNYLAFTLFTGISGNKTGYWSGMIFYWLLWCIVPVFLLISKSNRKLLLKIKRLNWWQTLLFILPVALVILFGPFKNNLVEASLPIIILSLLFAFINAFCEEFLWRGLYFDHHPGNFFYAVIVPSIWFGIWHYVPLSIQSSSISNFYFILITIGMGFCWSVITFYTRSVFWNIISHTLVDLTGLIVLYF